MKKKRKLTLIIVALTVILAVAALIIFSIVKNKNELNVVEKEWINNNKSNVTSFSLPSDLNIFAQNGAGVIHDFLADLTEKYSINIDKQISPANVDNLGFSIKEKLGENDLLLFKDHYVLVGKILERVEGLSSLKDKTIGALPTTIELFSKNNISNITFSSQESRTALTTALSNNTLSYMIVPLNEYLDDIITNNYKVIYHFDEFSINYVINKGENKTLASIINKFYNEWMKDSFEKSYYTNTYKLYTSRLQITELKADSLTNKTYKLGFVNATPYINMSNSIHGGILDEYINEFSKMSNVDFKYVMYKDYSSLVKAFNNKKVDLIINNTSLTSDFVNIPTNINNKFYIVSPSDKKNYYNNINSVDNEKIYVIKNSSIHGYLSKFENIKLETVKDEKKLLKALKKGNMIAIEKYTYEFSKNKVVNNSYVSFEGFVDNNISFKYMNNTDTFYELFSTYINTLSLSDMTRIGISSALRPASNSSTASMLAKYILGTLVIIAGLVGGYLYSKKHLNFEPKIRKDEKLKYIDMLTSLKNRNYLNERISVWNQNTIYPQAIIVIDLNNIKYLNDTFGHEEGDKQIKAAANILHQTQPDNTEIMRTDGNEFMVYLVGFQEKQVINYLKKLVKEFNNLPYEYGAAFGFSMIVDDLKLIDDAINEATIQMRENKEIEAETNEKEEIL